MLADPSLRESTFKRSVILLVQHSAEEGALGLILNHPTEHLVGDVLKDGDFAPLGNLVVHDGGPVAREQLTFCALWWSKTKGLSWALRISAEEAIEHSRRPGRLVSAFIGYSGWTAGQLEGEIRRNSWVTIRPASGILGHPHDSTLWTELFANISPLHRLLSTAPDDPFLN